MDGDNPPKGGTKHSLSPRVEGAGGGVEVLLQVIG